MNNKSFITAFLSFLLLTGVGCTAVETVEEPLVTQTPVTQTPTTDNAATDPSVKDQTVSVNVAPSVCQDPTSIPVSPSDADGNFTIENVTINRNMGDVATTIGDMSCPSDACLVMTPQNLSKVGPPRGSDITFFFDRPVSELSFSLCDSSQAMTAHGYVDSPDKREDEVRSIDATGESACGKRNLSFDPPINRATIEGNDADTNLIWGVDDVVVTWSCE